MASTPMNPHTPVSYTHLDVYKRQPLGGAAGGREAVQCVESLLIKAAADIICRRPGADPAVGGLCPGRQRCGGHCACLLYTSRCV